MGSALAAELAVTMAATKSMATVRQMVAVRFFNGVAHLIRNSVFPDLLDVINGQLVTSDLTRPPVWDIGCRNTSMFVFGYDDLFDLFWGSTLNNHIIPDHLRPPIVVNEGDMVFDHIIGVPVSHHYLPVGSHSRAE